MPILVSEDALQDNSILLALAASVRPLWGGGHSGQNSQFLAPQDIPDISGYQLGIGCQFVKAHINEIPGPDQKIFQIRFGSNSDICKIVNECPGQHHVKAQVWSFET